MGKVVSLVPELASVCLVRGEVRQIPQSDGGVLAARPSSEKKCTLHVLTNEAVLQMARIIFHVGHRVSQSEAVQPQLSLTVLFRLAFKWERGEGKKM